MKTKIINKPEKIFILLGTIFISIAILVMPLNRVPDESNHARMVWNILYRQTDDSFQWMNSVSTETAIDYEEYKEVFTEKIDLNHEEFDLSFGLKNIVHLPQLLGMMLGRVIYPSIGVMMMLGRIFNALFYLLGMYFVIKKLRYGKMALVFTSLLPIMVQQAASLSYDVANFVAISAFFALMSDLSITKVVTKKKALLLLLSTISLYITKYNNLFLLLLLFTMDLRFEDQFIRLNTTIEKIKAFVWKYKIALGALFFIVGIAGATLYFQRSVGITHFIHVMLNSTLNNNLNDHINGILTAGIFGYFGNFAIPLPMWMVFVDVAVLTILIGLQTEFKLNKIFGAFSGLMFPIQICVIIAGMYFQWTPIVLGENAIISVGAQGRYFTPFLIFLVPLFISFKDKLTITYKKDTICTLTIATLLINFLIMMYLVIPLFWLHG